MLPVDATAPTRIDKYPNDFATRRRVFERHAQVGEIRACYEASGAGYLLRRAMQAWGDGAGDGAGGWRRVASPRQRMAYLGFVPRERSSGERERRGSITRAGNAHCRLVLEQAAWAYRLHPKTGPALVIRQRANPQSSPTTRGRRNSGRALHSTTSPNRHGLFLLPHRSASAAARSAQRQPLHPVIRPLVYGPTHRFGMVRRSKR